MSEVPSVVEVRAYPEDCAAWALTVEPGADTATVLDQLDPARLSAAGRVDALLGLERVMAWAAAGQVRLIAAMAGEEFADTDAPQLEREWVSEDVRVTLGESVIGARARLHYAKALTARLPDTLAALAAGRITARQAEALVDAVGCLPDAAAEEVQRRVLPGPARPGGEPAASMAVFRRKLRRAVLIADPTTSETETARAVENRQVWSLPREHGMALVGAELPAEGAAAVMDALDAHAASPAGPEDARTKAQRRADALVQICLDSVADIKPGACPHCGHDMSGSSPAKIDMDTPDGAGGRPHYRGLRPAVQVSVALSTLLGLDDQPGDLAGYGTIPASIARHLAADPTGTWRRLITDPRGHLLDYGRTTYRPPKPLAGHITARDRRCRFPGCSRRADKADLHHIQPWSRGGTTDERNLVALCERHHYAVHDSGGTPAGNGVAGRGGWQLRLGDGGSVEWTAPDGHTHHTEPDPYPIDHTADLADGSEDQNEHTDAADGGTEAA